MDDSLNSKKIEKIVQETKFFTENVVPLDQNFKKQSSSDTPLPFQWWVPSSVYSHDSLVWRNCLWCNRYRAQIFSKTSPSSWKGIYKNRFSIPGWFKYLSSHRNVLSHTNILPISVWVIYRKPIHVWDSTLTHIDYPIQLPPCTYECPYAVTVCPSMSIHCKNWSMTFIPNCHWNHTKFNFGIIPKGIWHDCHTLFFAV